MKMLDVPLFTQVNPLDGLCVAACLKMVLDYYGVANDFDQLKQALPCYSIYNDPNASSGLSLPQIGSYALQQGLRAEIITCNPMLFKFTDAQKAPSDLREVINSFAPKQQSLELEKLAFLDFMNHDGKLTVEIPTVEKICALLDDGKPAIVLLTNFFAHEKETRRANFHCNVIIGYDGEEFILLDPAPAIKNPVRMSQDQLLFSVQSITLGGLDNGAILTISR